MDPSADPRFVDVFERAWPRARSLAAAVVGDEQAERVTIEAFARTFERWHRASRRPDATARALGRTADAAIRQARRQGSSVPRRAEEVPDPLRRSEGTVGQRTTVDTDLRAAIIAMPRRVGTAFVLRHLAELDDAAVASATRTSPRRAGRRAERGMAILRREAGPDAVDLVHA